MSSTSAGGTGSSKRETVKTVAEVIGVFIAFFTMGVAAFAAWQSREAADAADTTAKRLQEIEEGRHDDERLEDLVAAQISSYFSSSCEDRQEMLAPTLDRFYDVSGNETEGITRAEVRKKCEAVYDDDLEFVLHEIEVIGTPESEHAYAFAKLGYYYVPEDHDLVGTTSLEIVMQLDRGWQHDEDPTFPITSMAETIEAA